MRLRNKITLEIGYTAVLQSKAIVVMDENAIQLASYTSLAELNAEWEDAPEEPKEYWTIRGTGYLSTELMNPDTINDLKQIGNLFQSKEEAELAIRKLKAWKRLEDKGFKFDIWKNNTKKYLGDFVIYAHTKDLSDIVGDLDLLFGGEE